MAVKRLLDIIFSFICIVALSPALLVIAVLIKLTISGNAIFSQGIGAGEREHIFILGRTDCLRY